MKHHAMKTYWAVEIWLHVFLTSALDGGEWSPSSLWSFSPWKYSDTHWIDRSCTPKNIRKVTTCM